MIFRFILINILLCIWIDLVYCSEVVEQLNKWPVPVESIVNFSINKLYNKNSEISIKVSNDRNEPLAHKNLNVMKKNYVDLSTDYFVIKRDKSLDGIYKFTFKMSFYKKSYGHLLTIDWIENGDRVKDVLSIYSDRISLTKEWRLIVKVQVLELENKKQVFADDIRLFQPGKKLKISCSAFDGLPQSKVSVTGSLTHKLHNISYDEMLNQWMGYLTLAVADHNHNLTFKMLDTTENYTVIVNHPTTAVRLNPEYNGFVTNGSVVTCEPFDGYPLPAIKWDFVSAKNSSNPESLFEIKNENLRILSTVSDGTQMEFNCSAFYRNPIDGVLSTVTRTFAFKVGVKPNDISNLNVAAIAASIAGVMIVLLAILIVLLLCRSKPKSSRTASNLQEESPKYDGSLLAGTKSALRNQANSHNGSNIPLMGDSCTTANTDHNELNYDDMPRGRRPIKVVDDPVIYSTIVGTMQPKSRNSFDIGPIDRV